MTVPLIDAQIAAQEKIRAAVTAQVLAVWDALPHYDEQQVPGFVKVASVRVLAAQRQSVLITNAYLAQSLGIKPVALNLDALTGPAVRAGVPDAERWRRPFVNVWAALSKREPWEQAVDAGRARAVGMAATDVQLAQRAAFAAVQHADAQIVGYRRKADPGACEFCRLVDGAFVKSASAMPLHPRCGCSLEPITRDAPPVDDVAPEGVVVHEHGELGPLLAAPGDRFTHLHP